MGFGVQIGNEFLKLKPGAKMEFEQENPFLQFEDAVKGDVSIPFDVPNDQAGVNMRLLQFASVLQQRVKAVGIDAIVYDGDNQHSFGKIRIERSQINLNRPSASSVSCFYLSGVSSFYKEIQGLKLRTMNFGGIRTFPLTDFTHVRDGSQGFWQHVHQVIDAPPGSYDYAFFPVINRSWTSGHATDLMNRMTLENGLPIYNADPTQGNVNRSYTPLVPFPYLRYVLKQAFASVGWELQGEILDDPDFKKIVLICFRAIDFQISGATEVKFNLADSLPNITLSAFLIALKNRFAWGYEFDRSNKVVYIKPLAVLGQRVKDFTRFVAPSIGKPVATERKGFSLKNEWSGAQPSQETINLQGYEYKGITDSYLTIPAPGPAIENWCYLIAADNSYYYCAQDPDTNVWYWALVAANVYDVVGPGEATEIVTSACVASNERWDEYHDTIPRIDMEGYWAGPPSFRNSGYWSDEKNDDWGIYLTFYHGLRNNRSGQPIPFASHHIYDPCGIQVGNWSLAFEGKRQSDHEEIGLINRWNRVADIFKSSEQLELSFNLPLDEFNDLRFSDAIVVDGVRMYITKMRSTVPYSGTISCDCIRI
ncbi:MAG: hypothetical protein EOP84_02055 [Verrucomicrobiaceae bacterium]|nr:MAG: hypothetical protein EOP84_02055 [Verrucomicrobiaceae bacterium]